MRPSCFVLILLVLKFSGLFGQANSDSIKVNISKLQVRNDSLYFVITIKSISSVPIAVFKPDIDYVNYGLISISLIDQVKNQKSYLDHGQRGDIDKIYLDNSDYITLNASDLFSKEIRVFLKEFTPKLHKGPYLLEVVLNYKIVNFNFPCSINTNVFKGYIKAITSERIKL